MIRINRVVKLGVTRGAGPLLRSFGVRWMRFRLNRKFQRRHVFAPEYPLDSAYDTL